MRRVRRVRRALRCGSSQSSDDENHPRPSHANESPQPHENNASGRSEEKSQTISQQQSAESVCIAPPKPPTAPSDAIPPKSTSLWQQAIERLPKDDKAWLEKVASDGPETFDGERIREIIDLVNKKRLECDAKRWKEFWLPGIPIPLGDIASKTIVWLNKFKEIGDIVVQYDPAHAALPWAAARFLLMCTIAYAEQMAASLIIIEKTSRIVHRCRVYELLYNRDTLDADTVGGLELALRHLYASLLQGLVQVGKFLAHRTRGRSLYAIFKPTASSDLLTDLETHEAEVIKEASVCQAQRHAVANVDVEEKLQKLQRLLDLEEPVLRIDENVEKVLEKLDIKELISVRDWISPIPYNLHHKLVSGSRTKDTCDWILRRPQFHEWQCCYSSVILWLQGSPGTGKTFTTSRVIDEIEKRLGSHENDEGFAFFYCNRTESGRQVALSVFRSYVRQLSSSKSLADGMYPRLRNLYTDSKLSASGWTLDPRREQLIHLFQFYPQTTLILDALDECSIEERTTILNFFDSLPQESKRPVKIFISSRPEGDIRQRLVHLPHIDISATFTNDDVAKFVTQSMESHSPWSLALKRSSLLKDEIVSALITKGDGMFQWAKLQIEQLRVLEHERDLRDRLGKLPTDLSSAYDEIYQKIEGRPKYSRVRTLRALQWVACANSPLSTKELLGAIRVDPSGEKIDDDDETTEEDLLGWCANLLILDSQRVLPVWRPSHLSVIEYLENRWTMSDVHCDVAMANLVLLLALEVYFRHYSYIGTITSYAIHNWGYHVRTQEKPGLGVQRAKLARLLKSFLGSPVQSTAQYARWVSFHSISRGSFIVHPHTLRVFQPNAPPLFAMCAFSLFYLLQDWWESDMIPKSGLHLAANSYSRNLLALVAESGCKEICAKLVEWGTPVNPECPKTWDQNPVAVAAQGGHLEMVEFLIKNGADVNVAFLEGPYRSPLATSVVAGHYAVAECLLSHGADTKILQSDGKVDSALTAAPDAKFIKLLIKNGADVNLQLSSDGTAGSVLAQFARLGQVDQMEVLVENKADVNMVLQAGRFGSALAAASIPVPFNPDLRFFPGLKFLVDHGADVNLQTTGEYGSALASAARGGSIAATQLLIDHGADVNLVLESGHFGSALVAGVITNSRLDKAVDITEFLLDAGADVNLPLQAGWYGSAAAAAAAAAADTDGAIDLGMAVLKLLIQRGADVNARLDVGVYGSALIAAAYRGNIWCVKLLLDAGADVNARVETGRFGTALKASRTDLTDEGGPFEIRSIAYSHARIQRKKATVEKLLLSHYATG